MHAQQVFKGTFNAIINEDYSTGVERNQSALEHAISNIIFSIRTGIYMLPSNVNLSIENTAGYNNKTLISNTNTKISSNKNVSKTEICYKKFNKSRLPGTLVEAHAASQMDSMKTLDKSIKTLRLYYL